MDWNLVVQILDTLSEATHSFLELSYMVPHYDRGAFTESLSFLADHQLVELSTGIGPFKPIPKGEWPQRFRDAFGTEGAVPSSMIDTASASPRKVSMSCASSVSAISKKFVHSTWYTTPMHDCRHRAVQG